MKRDVFSQSKRIWLHTKESRDEYCDFYVEFIADTKEVFCRISADTEYALYVNGRLAASYPHGDFPHHAVYDTVDLRAYVHKGKNSLAITVWHCGVSNQRYIAAPPGLIYEVCTQDSVLLQSDERTAVRKSRCYASGRERWITPQLGFTFCYDANKEDDWQTRPLPGFSPAVAVDKPRAFYPRPIQTPHLSPLVKGECIGQSGARYLLDLGRETVGIASLSFVSPQKQTITVAYGEHLRDGGVRQKIGGRDFSFTYIAKAGKNASVHPFLRLGCRYLELICEVPVTLEETGICPQIYPVQEVPRRFDDPTDERIYAMCLRTLELCMMEHYVDCPWREQNLYAYDARNQMLCGYYAFADGNFAYARANLLLMRRDSREDGLLSVCFPCGVDLTIPAFSLYWILAAEEYMRHSADVAIFYEIDDKLRSVLQTFLRNTEDGLICKFGGKTHWNFYDWSASLAGTLYGEDAREPDLVIGCLVVLALRAYETMCKAAGAPFAFGEEIARLRKNLKDAFFRADSGLFSLRRDEETYTELGNSLAVSAGLTLPDEAARICERLQERSLERCSLGMMPFRYDAMLSCDPAYKGHILREIREIYGKMLAAGATSAWETEEGADAFDGAGSLCHGWSAMPVYYYATHLSDIAREATKKP